MPTTVSEIIREETAFYTDIEDTYLMSFDKYPNDIQNVIILVRERRKHLLQGALATIETDLEDIIVPRMIIRLVMEDARLLDIVSVMSQEVMNLPS
jgi:hypothetical protein